VIGRRLLQPPRLYAAVIQGEQVKPRLAALSILYGDPEFLARPLLALSRPASVHRGSPLIEAEQTYRALANAASSPRIEPSPSAHDRIADAPRPMAGADEIRRWRITCV
jgi:hypothetical protein